MKNVTCVLLCYVPAAAAAGWLAFFLFMRVGKVYLESEKYTLAKLMLKSRDFLFGRFIFWFRRNKRWSNYQSYAAVFVIFIWKKIELSIFFKLLDKNSFGRCNYYCWQKSCQYWKITSSDEVNFFLQLNLKFYYESLYILDIFIHTVKNCWLKDFIKLYRWKFSQCHQRCRKKIFR